PASVAAEAAITAQDALFVLAGRLRVGGPDGWSSMGAGSSMTGPAAAAHSRESKRPPLRPRISLSMSLSLLVSVPMTSPRRDEAAAGVPTRSLQSPGPQK